MKPPSAYSAVLLAGGRSRRMGGDKALLPCGAESLWRRQWQLLEAAGAGEIFLSVRPDQSWVPAGIAVVHDSVPDAGPLAGIVAALATCRGTHLLVLAVDLPGMQPVWFAQLAAACTPGRGAVGRHGGFFEPLAAIYPREMLPAAEQALARSDFSLQHLIAAAGDLIAAHEITDAEASWFENWNEPH